MLSPICKTIVGTCLSVMTLTGCTSLGDAVIPPHQASDIREGEQVCIDFIEPKTEFAPMPLIASGAGAILGWSIDQTSKALAQEASRYTATYSAREAESLLKSDKNGKAIQRYSGLRVTRYYKTKSGKTCQGIHTDNKSLHDQIEKTYEAYLAPEENGRNTALKDLRIAAQDGQIASESFGELVLTADGSSLQYRPKYFVLFKSKAKVSALYASMPWTWWRILDRDVARVEVTLRMNVTTVHKAGSSLSQDTIMNVDIPLGKADLENPQFMLLTQSSGWSPVPKVEIPATGNVPLLPLTFSVTTIESDKFGDVIAEAGKTLGDNKAKLVDEALKIIGLEK